MRGWLCEYWEQGWEGARWWVFQPVGTEWDLDRMILLSDCEGARLTVYSPDGSVLWSGKLQMVTREGFLGLRRVSDWDGGWYPKGVTLEQWRNWCQHNPPLAAELEMDG